MGGPAAGAPAAPDPMVGGMPAPGGDPMGGMPTPGGAPGGDPMAGTGPNAMGGDPMAGGMPGGAPGGDPMADGAGFDMGIGMTPDEDQKKYIEGAAAKIATELRKYQQGLPKPDMELNKTAVNTIAAATKTGLQPNQEDELMSSYADTMRREGGEGSDGSEGSEMPGPDTGADATDGADAGTDPSAMGTDPMAGTDAGAGQNTAGADQMAGGAGAGTGEEQAPLQERFNKALKEFFERKKKEREQKPQGEIEQLGQRDSFSRKPFMPPVNK